MNNLAHVRLHDLVTLYMGLDLLCKSTADDLLGPDAYDLYNTQRLAIGQEFHKRGVNRSETYREISGLLPEYPKVAATVAKIRAAETTPDWGDDGHDVGYNTAADESELA